MKRRSLAMLWHDLAVTLAGILSYEAGYFSRDARGARLRALRDLVSAYADDMSAIDLERYGIEWRGGE